MSDNPQETSLAPATRVPVMGEYDVVVCGGGPAGIGAAVSAGREGAKTLLIERLAYIGGVATTAFINNWVDTQGGPVFDDLERRLTEIGAATRRFNPANHIHPAGRVRLHGETLKAVALKMLREAGADVLLCALAESAWVVDGGVAGVFVAAKGGRSLVRAKAVVDATADGDVAASAGAEFLKGDPEDGRLQHVNFLYRTEQPPAPEDAPDREPPSDDEIVAAIKQAIADGEIHPPTGVMRPTADTFPFHSPEGVLALNKWEIEKVDPSDPMAVSAALVECQLAAFEVTRFLAQRFPHWQGLRLSRFPDTLGTRESRRIVGRYVLTRDDVIAGRKFEDGVAKCCFFIDYHDSPPGVTIPYSLEYKRANRPPDGDWYEIPLRSLLPRDVDGLLVAGRCISSDRAAQASSRGMPTCMYTGSAAGAAAALAAADGVAPHEVDARRVREKMMV